MIGFNRKWVLLIIGVGVIFFILQFQFDKNNTFNGLQLPLSGKIIYLDPGHGGVDGGAGKVGALEKDIALEVSLKLRDYLQEQGALVILTREHDTDLADVDTKGYSRRKVEDLKERVKRINESEADMFLSIHLNSIPSAKWSGAQAFFSPHMKESEAVSKAIQYHLKGQLENTTRDAKAVSNIFILKNTTKPGALIEIGFLSNPAERELLVQDKYQDRIAATIYAGVMEYYQPNSASLK
ncbi:N-acetylmuramoyl-L-alanine amidase CwlD [Mangrovibacillus cuniculi]|uniref:N-acetylmuramoyl-L-alanine amidase CwlD n=1 Tax=Mangrovibacillus cuniculi TaxID=2593652 RepID=A0A7S8CDN8_9BACI|nr:N-acetylmuramoyl-L-alanine amidase CwlD [Mangrovibacillus cuniculi]QPC48070.1 N-acetylmuramoyl-L-alanine amidase CwlD [Mangrovibacillus cuniculi]